jgi:hypothetical protein
VGFYAYYGLPLQYSKYGQTRYHDEFVWDVLVRTVEVRAKSGTASDGECFGDGSRYHDAIPDKTSENVTSGNQMDTSNDIGTYHLTTYLPKSRVPSQQHLATQILTICGTFRRISMGSN